MTTTRFQAPRGTPDVLPEMQPYWDAVLRGISEVTDLFGFQRIDTPVFEAAGLFEKGTGDTTDVVEKEMYVFEDRGGDLLALAPEATPAIVRAYLEHGMGIWPQPVRLFTVKPMFRYDRPQKGRYRQFTQFDCEVLGSSDPLVDAEVIQIAWLLYANLGLNNLELRLSSIDDIDPRQTYVERLKEYFRPHLSKLSEDSQRRFERNPLRLLDSKDERDLPFKENAPKLIDALSPEAQDHHELVTAALTAAGIPFTIDPLLVRGLDYYNRTVFEIVPQEDTRAQGSVMAGGRYDGLVELLGGPSTPSTGFAAGIERSILEMQKNEVSPPFAKQVAVYVVHRGDSVAVHAMTLATTLRQAGIAAQIGESGRSFKAQLRRADSSGARVALILGEDEIARGAAMVKPLRVDSEQVEAPISGIVDAVRKALAE